MLEVKSFTSLKSKIFLIAATSICCLAVIFFAGFDTIFAKARDVKRRMDLQIISNALDLYHEQYGSYPDSINDWQGWDLSFKYKGRQLNFLRMLKEGNFIDRTVVDPLNNDIYHYRYQKYQTGDYGCVNSFYILQAVNFELSAKSIGNGKCPEYDWTEEALNGYTIQKFD